MRYRPGKNWAVTSRPTIRSGRTKRCLISHRLMSISSTTRARYWSNSTISKERHERNEKPTGRKNQISAKPQSRRDVQVRVSARSLILGQIRKPFLNANHRILKSRVPQTKTTHLTNRFCLTEKKLDNRSAVSHCAIISGFLNEHPAFYRLNQTTNNTFLVTDPTGLLPVVEIRCTPDLCSTLENTLREKAASGRWHGRVVHSDHPTAINPNGWALI